MMSFVKRVMLDLETLDTRPTAAVLSIGAIEFDPLTGTGEEFYQELDLPMQVSRGRTIGPDTVVWWMQQTPEARRVMLPVANGGLPKASSFAALEAFTSFVQAVGRGGDVEMWAYGADFDCVILGGMYDTFGMQRPWSYSKNRCFRTLARLVPELVVPQREGTHHNALDDARYQALCANLYLRQLGIK